MMSGDGVWCRCHPIFAIFVGNYPEQGLVAYTYYSCCPKCTVPTDQLGEYQTFSLHVQRSLLDVYELADINVHTFHFACHMAGTKPIYHPFWETLPLADVFLSITPNILHQLLQGMVKHIISWLVGIFGTTVIDTQCRAIPPNHNVMLFLKGITTFSQVFNHKHKKMCSILLGLVVNLPVPDGQDSTCVIRAIRALMNFVYLAQYKSHMGDTISALQDSLTRFHDNKDVFLDLGIWEDFNLPKLHSLSHYALSIYLFSMMDNYNTEQT